MPRTKWRGKGVRGATNEAPSSYSEVDESQRVVFDTDPQEQQQQVMGDDDIPELFNCEFPGCDYFTDDRGGLDCHIATAHPKKTKYPCPKPSCPYVAYTPSCLKLHVTVRHGDKNLPCHYENCERVFSNDYSLQMHIRNAHTHPTKFKLRNTSYRVWHSDGTSKVSNIQAEAKRYGQVPFDNMIIRQKNVDPSCRYRCGFEDCFYTCPSLPDARRHINCTHTKAIKYTCTHEGCDFESYNPNSIRQHIRVRHFDIHPNQCPFPGCEKRYAEADELRQHFAQFPTHNVSTSDSQPKLARDYPEEVMALIYGTNAKGNAKGPIQKEDLFRRISSEQEKAQHQHLTSKIRLEKKKMEKQMKEKEEMRLRKEMRDKMRKELEESNDTEEQGGKSTNLTTRVERVVIVGDDDAQSIPGATVHEQTLPLQDRGSFSGHQIKRLRLDNEPTSSSNKENNQSVASPFPGLALSPVDDIEPDRPVAPDEYSVDELVSLLEN